MSMRLYSEDEARALLPEVIPIVEDLRDAFVRLRALQATIAADARGATGDGALTADPWQEGGDNELEQQSQRMRLAAAKLERLAIEVKDPERGLIDFYSQRDGEVVYLCYLLGEPDLGYWHGLQDGFAGRRPL
jgi:hypothetical protein